MAGFRPEQLANGSEHGEQSALFCWAALPEQQTRFPFFRKLLFAVPNGGSRGDTRESAKLVGGKMKAEGVKPGVADILLAFPWCGYHGLFIEMKRADGGTQSIEQKEFEAWASWANYKYVLCFGWHEAVEQIEQYLTNCDYRQPHTLP